MNAAACQQVMEGVGSGVAASLRAVDCAAGATAQAAFGRLFGTEGALLPALTILLTIYVALFAFGLITGRSRLGVSALTPRMITIGLVLTFATSWLAYQGVVWNLAVGAPDYLAGVLTGSEGSATQVFADKIDVVLGALMQASSAQASETAPTTFSPEGLMWLGGMLLLLGTVGVLATSKIALAILLGIGPVFVVLALFSSTRGLFTGWLKGVVLLAVTPLFAVLGGSLMLELAVPVLRGLVQPNMGQAGQIDERAAMAFFMIGAVHMALMVMVLKVAGTMVSGWTVFGLAIPKAERGHAAVSSLPVAAAPVAAAANTQRTAGVAPSRDVRLAPAMLSAANDTGPPSAGSVHRETRVAHGATLASEPAAHASQSRTRGIGSRVRGANPRPLEKFR